MAPETFCACRGQAVSRWIRATLAAPRGWAYGETQPAVPAYAVSAHASAPPVKARSCILSRWKRSGIDLTNDIKFEGDNWEGPTVARGVWLAGAVRRPGDYSVHYLSAMRRFGTLDPICAELTYGLERLRRWCRNWTRFYDIVWARDPETGAEVTYGDVLTRGIANTRC